VVVEDTAAIKDGEDCRLDQRTEEPTQEESADDGCGCPQGGGAKAEARKLEDGFESLPPIPPAGEESSRFGCEDVELLKQISLNGFCFVGQGEKADQPRG
jgi:hypothetical protein